MLLLEVHICQEKKKHGSKSMLKMKIHTVSQNYEIVTQGFDNQRTDYIPNLHCFNIFYHRKDQECHVNIN